MRFKRTFVSHGLVETRDFECWFVVDTLGPFAGTEVLLCDNAEEVSSVAKSCELMMNVSSRISDFLGVARAQRLAVPGHAVHVS